MVTSGKPRGDKGSSRGFEGRAFQAEGTVLAKVLSQRPAWKEASMTRTENRGGVEGDGPRGNSSQWDQMGVDPSSCEGPRWAVGGTQRPGTRLISVREADREPGTERQGHISRAT